MDQFRTFCTGAGWTQDEWDTVNDRLALHRNNVYVQFHWDNTDDIAFWQSLGFTVSLLPGQHPNDAGNAAESTGAITQGRRINVKNNGPFLQHHFFASASAPYYAYGAVEVAEGIWRFWGMGEIAKIGDWTGGEFCFGTGWFGSLSVPYGSTHTMGWDIGVGASSESIASYLHIEGLPNMNASSKWGLFTKGTTLGNDTAGNPRYPILGGIRGGFYANHLSTFPLGNIQNMLPLIPIPAFYLRTDTTPDLVYLLGHKPDCRQLNMKFFIDTQEITVGSDVWKIFPMNRKLDPTGANVDQSGYGALAFKKIT